MSAFALLTDALILVACAAAASACFVLNSRLKRLESTEGGIGKAVAQMSQAAARLEAALAAADHAAGVASAELDERIAQARALAQRLGSGTDAGSGSDPASQLHSSVCTPASGAGAQDPLAEIVPRGFAPPLNALGAAGQAAR